MCGKGGFELPSPLASRILGGRRNYFWLYLDVALALDQVSKHFLVGTAVSPGLATRRITLIPGLLDLLSRWNRHSAFSLGPGNALFYIIATLAGLALIGYFFATTPPDRLRPHLGLGLVAGGALGNLIDRIAFQAVRDMIDAHLFDWAHWPTFNVADTAICIGVGLLLLEAFQKPKESDAGKAGEAVATPDSGVSRRKRRGSRRR